MEAVAKEGVSLDLIMLGGDQSICNYVSFSDDKGKPQKTRYFMTLSQVHLL